MKLYSEFHNAILENDSTQVKEALKPHPRLTGAQQFAIYSEGYRIRLTQAIRSDYPILLKLLGDKVFDALAGAYVEQNPPASYNLDFYPHNFAGFLREKCADVFAGELAVLEATIAEVFMLSDSESFSLDKFSQIQPENFGDMVFNLRTACRLLQFSYPVNEWFSDARAKENLPEIPLAESNFLLVIRNNNEVQRHSLNEQEFALLMNLTSGNTVAEALEKTLEEQTSYAENIINSLQGWFIGWIKNGVFIDI